MAVPDVKLRGILIFILCAFALSSANQVPCKLANDKVDKVVNQTNYHLHSEDDDTLNVDGFNRHLPLTLFGFNLPWKVFLKLDDGLMYSMASLSRVGDMLECSNSTYQDLEGVLTYDRMEMSFKSFKAEFLFWKIVGKFTYRFKPYVNLVYSHINDDCGPEPLSIKSVEDHEYEIITGEDSWRAWLVTKAVHWALKKDEHMPLLADFLHSSWVSLDCYFSWYYCK